MAGLLTCFMLCTFPTICVSGIVVITSLNEVPKQVRHKLTVAGTVLELIIKIAPDSLLIHQINSIRTKILCKSSSIKMYNNIKVTFSY